ncbi:hypothetical protein OIU78_017095 [Salix suchowensis]|nr:hypothetical protein OIU78_017095 [Salix suchowensis]
MDKSSNRLTSVDNDLKRNRVAILEQPNTSRKPSDVNNMIMGEVQICGNIEGFGAANSRLKHNKNTNGINLFKILDGGSIFNLTSTPNIPIGTSLAFGKSKSDLAWAFHARLCSVEMEAWTLGAFPSLVTSILLISRGLCSGGKVIVSRMAGEARETPTLKE